jgi:hypothetical protein
MKNKAVQMFYFTSLARLSSSATENRKILTTLVNTTKAKQ